jgi:disulfide bond formation protein DsbB
VSSVAGLYHFGIEMNFWSGPDECSSSIDFSRDLLKYLLNKSPIKCDEVMFKILGLSLAGWNALMSFVMFSIVSVFLMKKGL